ncbi:hypothetical protein HDK90DRAFT_123148 [Phyllosticta capitalensis]|uniref:RNA-dependent RNA polymerase n=1 Tax=Phyllosticta capitalensis TaxID=121624 RepID=A0ABR1YXK2_9PEZI
MLSGPDLITYISVPLTLTGIVQIYILCKALWIFYKLYRSLPKKMRPFYSFYPDPSSGTVLVIAPTMVCTNPGLWHENAPSKYFAISKPSQSTKNGSWMPWRRRKSSVPVLPTARDWDEKKLNRCHLKPSWMTSQTKISLEPRRFRVGEPNDLFRPWMGTAASLGFKLTEVKELVQGEFYKWARDVRITVGIDMGIPPQKLAVPWRLFVWFALAIGTNPFDLDPTSQKFKFKHITKPDEVVMRLSRDGDDWNFALDTDHSYEYSIRRALSLMNVMCFDRKGAIFCRFVGSQDEFKLTPDFFRRPGHFIAQNAWLGDSSRSEEDQVSAIKGLQSAAMTWIFYKEQYAGRALHESGKELLVCQWMLEAQQRSLMFLYELDVEGTLEHRLSELVRENSGHAASVQDLLKVLRHDFQSSAYLTKSSEFVFAVRSIAERIQGFQYQSLSESGATSTAEDFEQLYNTWSKPLEPSHLHFATPDAATATMKAGMGWIEMRRKLLSELSRCSHFADLRRLYDPHRSDHVVESELIPPGEMELIAHLYLAIQPWQHHRRTIWELSPCIQKPLEMLKGDGDSDKALSLDGEHLMSALERLEEDAKRGIYSAPWERDMIYDLLKSDDVPQVVYLV